MLALERGIPAERPLAVGALEREEPPNQASRANASVPEMFLM